MKKVCDPHIHLFDLEKGHYRWLRADREPFWPDKARIRKNFSVEDLVLGEDKVLSAFVHIEAGFDNEEPSKELAWLETVIGSKYKYKALGLADLSLAPLGFSEKISKMEIFPSFVGIRYIFDDDGNKFTNDHKCKIEQNIRQNLLFLEKRGHILELQCDFTCDQSANFILTLVDELKDLKIVLNHSGFIPIMQRKSHYIAEKYKRCFSNLKRFSKSPNHFVKCSGIEMLKRDYQQEELKQILVDILKLFGNKRVMLASNFPLVLFSQSYCDYWTMVFDILNDLGENTKALTHDNASVFYGL